MNHWLQVLETECLPCVLNLSSDFGPEGISRAHYLSPWCGLNASGPPGPLSMSPSVASLGFVMTVSEKRNRLFIHVGQDLAKGL